MRTRAIAASAIFYIVVTALLCGVLFEFWVNVFPKAISSRIGHNTEGYIIALAIALWIQFARPRLQGARAEWIITILVALAFVGLTVYLLTGGVASRFKTLNEGTLATALLIPYVQLRRPMPRKVVLWAAIVLVVITAVTSRTSETTDLAETWGMLILGVVGLDLVDRGILDSTAVTSVARRWLWYAFLIVAPIVFSLAEYHWGAGSSGVIGTPVRFLVRITEAFIFALFVEVFFAIGLGRTGVRSGQLHAEPSNFDESVALPAPTSTATTV
jgi:hypothetical protein